MVTTERVLYITEGLVVYEDRIESRNGFQIDWNDSEIERILTYCGLKRTQPMESIDGYYCEGI